MKVDYSPCYLQGCKVGDCDDGDDVGDDDGYDVGDGGEAGVGDGGEACEDL